MKSALIPWFMLFSLLLQSVAWALPAQRLGQAAQLAHEVAHARDHGHHEHGDSRSGHVQDLSLALPSDGDADGATHGPHHSHPAESMQLQGLPVAPLAPAWLPPRSAHGPSNAPLPPSADLAAWLRPPKAQD